MISTVLYPLSRSAAGLQVAVDGDVQLAELAEALERLLAA